MSAMSHELTPSHQVDNPFASRFVRAGAMRYRDPGTLSSLATVQLMEQLKRVRSGAIEGEHGTGKSTLLNTMASDLEQHFPGGQWVQLTRPIHAGWIAWLKELTGNALVTLRAQSNVELGGVLVIDGAEQLPPGVRALARYRAWMAGQFILITTHSPRRGFVCLYRTSLNRNLIEGMLDELLGPITDEALTLRIRVHFNSLDLSEFSNVRDLWSHMYDWFEARS